MPSSTKATNLCHQYHLKVLPTFAIFSSSKLRKHFTCKKTISYDVVAVRRSDLNAKNKQHFSLQIIAMAP